MQGCQGPGSARSASPDLMPLAATCSIDGDRHCRHVTRSRSSNCRTALRSDACVPCPARRGSSCACCQCRRSPPAQGQALQRHHHRHSVCARRDTFGYRQLAGAGQRLRPELAVSSAVRGFVGLLLLGAQARRCNPGRAHRHVLHHRQAKTRTQLTTLFVLATFVAVYIGMALGGWPGLKMDRTGIALLGAIVLYSTGLVSNACLAGGNTRSDRVGCGCTVGRPRQ
jgi:hypothetical protein